MVISPEKSAVEVLFINIFKFVRFYLVLYHADFSGDIMFCERDLVRERDLVHLKPSNFDYISGETARHVSSRALKKCVRIWPR